ncbi:T9SS type A sorting domain-containing protein [candidate division TA06 bacterium]|uniref:T9SS type A sorting domain-containing protein n=1 Tax=candidate division TA06 bacterium TaxID=2250710 RepID=A0A523US74_UNCT6|nr:MAG: T9SS type A sorting domain-containing protein [candidate division TA06 bacterium]
MMGATLRSRVIMSLVFGICFLFPLTPQPSLAQITFERTYGGAMEDRAFCVQQTADGGYVLVGLTSSFGAGFEDVYVVKTDSIGDPIWTRTYGGSSFDDAAFVEQTNDRGYIIAGTAFVIADSAFRIYLIKTDSLGDSLWTRTYGNSLADFGSCVRQTKDGGYIVAGVYSYNDVYLIKTDSVGDSLWSGVYGDFTPEYGYGVQETDDGGYIVVGRYFAGPRNDVYLVKTDSIGNALWTKTYGGDDSDVGYCVEQTGDGGYVLVGYTSSFGAGQEDIYLIRTDSSGDTLWTRTYGGNSLDWGYLVHETSDGGYVICGGTWSFGPGHIDAYLIKTDSFGDTIWTRTFGGFSEDWGSCVQITDDGGYVVAGWAASFGAGNYDFYLIKTDSLGRVLGIQEQDRKSKIEDRKSLQNQPNPFHGSTLISYSMAVPAQVTLKIYDIIGRLVETLVNETQGPGLHRVRWDAKDQPSGIYFYRLRAGDFTAAKKMILVR